jgi:type IV pilus assembly protein PilY1
MMEFKMKFLSLNSLKRAVLTTAAAGLCAATALMPQSVFAVMASSPLVEKQTEPPLILLTVGRDEQLFYTAYSDYTDIDGDGLIDTDYKPGVITYFGLFDSLKCYQYSSGNQRFEPYSNVVNAQLKTCGNGVAWSGDWLNYMTTSRADAVRRVLYGGRRVVDDETTVLERAYIPQDSHVWGKEFHATRSGYDIRQYTPLSTPTSTLVQHFFANATTNGSASNAPLFRVLLNRSDRIWNWVAQEGPVGSTKIDRTDANGKPVFDKDGNVIRDPVTPTDYVVRVQVCVNSPSFAMESDCKGYPAANPTSWKPTGILHDYGGDRSVAFGLLTGSYEKARSGGVIRKNISFFDDEFSTTTGRFTATNGIVSNLDKIRITGWSGSAGGGGSYGNVQDYGNPVAEMMYEGLRYIAGASSGLPLFDYSGGTDASLGLTKPAWLDPYRGRVNGGFATCAKPFQMVISDLNPTFDSDDLPGTPFGSTVGGGTPAALSGLNVASQGSSIWASEALGVGNYFIGNSLSNTPNYDQAPTAKTVSSFGNIRGISPAQPTRQGSYFAGSVAKFGAENAISSQGAKKVETYAIALAPALPKIQIPTGLGTVSIAPFGKSTVGCTYGEFVPGTTFLTNRIVGFFFDQVKNIPGFPTDAAVNGGRAKGKFRVSFEDNEQGTDNDMDAISTYDFVVNANQSITINISSDYAATCIGMRMGFTISGTTTDGAFLGVRDTSVTATAAQAYALEDPANSTVSKDGSGMGFNYSRTFTPSGAGTGGGYIPHDPLWYAAKYGVVAPNVWDANNDGVPDNYALATNPVKLKAQIAAAIDAILSKTTDSASITTTGGLIRTDTGVGSLGFSAAYGYGNTSIPRTSGPPITAPVWEGRVDAIFINTDGSLGSVKWSTSNASFDPDTTRSVVTKVGAVYKAFRPANLAEPLITSLAPANVQSMLSNTLTAANGGTALTAAQLKLKTAEAVTSYLMGNQSLELGNAGPLRARKQILGDIIGSIPAYQGVTDFGYSRFTYPGAGTTYASFAQSKKTLGRERVWVGANDGILHAFDARTGKEVWGFIPEALQANLYKLSQPGYVHQYYVNGHVAVGDVYNGASWRTIVVAAMGAGARTIVAIDATDATPTVLWEYTSPDLGFVIGKLAIARVATSKTSTNWAVIFGNGYESSVAITGGGTKTVSRLFVLNALDGASLGNAGQLTVPDTVAYNGMGTPAIVADAYVTDVWAGDLGGNLWRFDLSNSAESSASGWGILQANRKPVFVAERVNNAGSAVIPQPITAQPAATKHPSRGWVVSFGTGKFFENEDRTNTEIQSIYTVFDELTPYLAKNLTTAQVAASADLRRANLAQRVVSNPTTSASGAFRELSAGGATVSGRALGWYFDLTAPAGQLPTGERVITAARTLVPYSFFGTIAPSADTCGAGSSGYLMLAGWLNGLVDKPLFDSNNDGLLTALDGNKAGYGSLDATKNQGFQSDVTLVSTADGGSIALVGLPWVDRAVTPSAKKGLNNAAKIGLLIGRTAWRQLQ